jgi:heavy metal sensor kinase
MKPPKLRTKLTLFYAASIALLLTAAGALFYNLFSYQLNKSLRDDLQERSAALRGYLHFEGDQATLVYDRTDPEEAYFVDTATRYYQIYDAVSGDMIVRSQQLQGLAFQYTPDEVRDLVRSSTSFTGIETEQVDLLLYNDLIKGPDGHTYLLQVGAPLTLRTSAARSSLHIILWLLPCGIVFALLSGWWIAGRVLRPLESLSAGAQEMSIARLHRRLPLTGAGDELDLLAGTFNDMFGRLDKAVGHMKDFTTSISHELRTPLTALRGEAEVALARAGTKEDYRRVLESQLEEFAKLSQMIDHMLTLARAEAGQIKLARDHVNLSDLVQSLVEQMETVAASKTITLAAKRDGEVVVIGDSGWLERVILNLLDNAIKFTPEGGHVEVSVRSVPGEAVLEVRDSGIGIGTQALPHVFERFYRADPSRSREFDGAGLGLSLVEWIVKEHQGHVSVESQPGQGSLFRVAIPLAPADARPI